MAQKKRERETRQVRVSQSLVDGYRKQVDKHGDAAAAYMDRAIAAYVRKYPDASTAQVRKFTYETMQAALPNFTDLAETLSCEFMSHLAEKYGWDDVNPVITGSTDYKLVDKKLHYLADLLNEGDMDGFKSSVTDVTKFYVKRSAQESMIRNCIDAGVRYARVPSGFETCSFCFMLASRGFVYGDEEKAGATHKFHPNCDCIVVPGAYGRTKIDGYDPQGMYDRWKRCAETVGENPDANDEVTNERIMREVETRDWHWLYTGEGPQVAFESEQVKKRVLPHELRTAQRLSNEFGIRSDFIQDYKWVVIDGVKRKIGLPDFRDGTEIKTLQGSKNPYGAMDNYLENASKKEGLKRVVVDNTESSYIGDDELIEAARKVWNDYPSISKLGIILKSGEFIYVNK